MRATTKLRCLASLLALSLIACEGGQGPAGPAGTNGKEGPAGPSGAAGAAGVAGAAGAAGPAGTAAVDKGTISGLVKDAKGTALQGATVATVPATTTAQTGADGKFTLSVPIGYYNVTASLASYANATLSGIGVAAGATTSANFTLAIASGALVKIAGKVKSSAGTALQGATVKVVGTTLQATTDAAGNYSIAGVPAPGPYFLEVEPPTGGAYLGADTRESLPAVLAENAAPDIVLSARPTDAAKYVGKASCTGCHSALGTAHAGSAHWRSLTQDASRHRYKAMWPAVGQTVDTGLKALDPGAGCAGSVAVYACQNTAGTYSFKFGGTTCVDGTGTVIPISGTYGGEGDGGIDEQSNVGRYKQRFMAKLADVPSAASWTYNPAADKAKDYLILPVQVTESGDMAKKFADYKGTEWCIQARTFARACSGCHNTGQSIAYTQDAAANITAYSYIDFNISCERCHGPGSEHAAGGGKGNKIINPAFLSARAERDVCGQCHAADAGKSAPG
jgi:hypothetical protein